jgi:membrane associated rhomboid family serine protease
MIPIRDDRGPRGLTPTTCALIAVWIGSYLLCLRLAPATLERWHDAIALDPVAWRRAVRVLCGEARGAVPDALVEVFLPLLAYKLVHGGALQVLANGLVFLVFGGRLEARAGALRFLLFHELVGVAAALAALAFAGARAPVAVGASAAVAGSIAGYLFLHLRSRVIMLVPVLIYPVFVEVPAILLALAWSLLQFRPVARLLEVGPSAPVDWPAYAGAVVAGLLLTPWLLRRRRGPGRRR